MTLIYQTYTASQIGLFIVGAALLCLIAGFIVYLFSSHKKIISGGYPKAKRMTREEKEKLRTLNNLLEYENN